MEPTKATPCAAGENAASQAAVLIFQIYEGTSQIQRMIIAKELFERNK